MDALQATPDRPDKNSTEVTNVVILRTYGALRAIPSLKEAPKGTHALAKNMRLLKAHVEDIEESRRKNAIEIFGEGVQPDPKSPSWKKFEDYCTLVDKTKVKVDVHRFALGDLNMAKNEVPHEPLSEIAWLITDF